MEHIEIRLANADDAESIAWLKAAVCPHDTADSTVIARAIQHENTAAHVAFIRGELTGFVAGFSTFAQNGMPRWEVDLLAVSAQYQGQGIAARLIDTNMQAGRQRGVAVFRALIREGNASSERAFARAGFTPSDDWFNLFVGTPYQPLRHDPPVNGTWLMAVQTFNYAGIWIEGAVTCEAFLTARALCARNNWDIAGAVIPRTDEHKIRETQAAGGEYAGTFRWWMAT